MYKPAFPVVYDLYKDNQEAEFGMSLREWYAGLAMQGLLTANYFYMEGETNNADSIAKNAFLIANAMIEQSEE